MNCSKAVVCLSLLLVIAFLASCGGSKTAPVSGAHVEQALSIQSAVAELDSMEKPEGADAAVFDQLKDALRDALLARGSGKLVATPPTGTVNAIPDLVITDNENGTYNYTWHYYNVGDYNQSGTVGIADITPLAIHFGQTWEEAVPGDVNTLPAVVDGSDNKKVDIVDVTPIARYFGVEVAAYRLEKSATGIDGWTEVQIIPLSEGLDEDTARMRFSVDITPEDGMWYRLVPLDAGGDEGQTSDAIQPPSTSTVWGHSWGNGDDDQANAVACDADGNTFVAGTYNIGTPALDAVLLKYSPDGTLLWTKTWGGTNYDYAYGVAVDADGNAYVTGETKSFGTAYQVFILKYAPDGTLLWQKTWGAGSNSAGRAVVLDGTGLLYVTGYTRTTGLGKAALLLLRYDTDGNYMDVKALSASQDMDGYALALDDTGNIYIGGKSKDTTSTQDDLLVVKYSFDLALQWQKQWGGDPGTDDAFGISTDISGNVYVGGRTYSGVGEGGYDVILMKLNPGGAAIWQETWGGVAHDEAFAMTIDSDANLYLAGGTYGFGAGNYDGLVLKFDSNGTRLWAKAWGVAGQEDTIRAIALGPGGIFMLAGWDPMANGAWGDASAGITAAQTVALVDAAGMEVASAGASANPTGTEGSPVGVEDTGGGGDDILVLQVDPAGW